MKKLVVEVLSGLALALVASSAFAGGAPVSNAVIAGPRNADPLEIVTLDLSWQGGTPPFQVELDYGQNNAPLLLPTTGPTTGNSAAWSWRNLDPGFVTVQATLVDGTGARVPFDNHYIAFGTAGPYYVHNYPYVEFDGFDCFSNRSRQANFQLNPDFDLDESFIEIVGESEGGGPIIGWRNQQAPTPPFFVNSVEVFEQLAPPPSGPLYYGIREWFSTDGLLPPLAYGDYDIPDTLKLLEAQDPSLALASRERYRIRMTTSDGGCVGSTAQMVLERNPPPLGVDEGQVGLVSEQDGFEFNDVFVPSRVETRFQAAARLGVAADLLLFCQGIAVRRAIIAFENKLEDLREDCRKDSSRIYYYDCDNPGVLEIRWCNQAERSCAAVESFQENAAWQLLMSERSILELSRRCLGLGAGKLGTGGADPGPEPIAVEALFGVGRFGAGPDSEIVVRGSFAEALVPAGGSVEIVEVQDPATATEFAAVDGAVQITSYAAPGAPTTLESGFRMLVLDSGETALLPPDTLFADGFEQTGSAR